MPDGLREASLALGSSRARTVWSVVLPTARTGITTAVVLGIARAVGETAPLLFTAFGYDLMNANPFDGAAGEPAALRLPQHPQAGPTPRSTAASPAPSCSCSSCSALFALARVRRPRPQQRRPAHDPTTVAVRRAAPTTEAALQ